MKRLLLVLIYFMFTSCAINYYMNIEEDTLIYNNANGNGESIAVIPKGSRVYITAGKKKYRKIKWERYKGWAVNPVYNNSLNASSSNSNNNSSDTNSSTSSNYSSRSSYKSPSPSTSSGGTVNVKGYYRKDGTYVRPHTRSAPKRR